MHQRLIHVLICSLIMSTLAADANVNCVYKQLLDGETLKNYYNQDAGITGVNLLH